MNNDFNNRQTGSIDRNTYYFSDIPEWRCEYCGKFNNRDARFCCSCGKPGPMGAGDMAVNNEIFVAEMPRRKVKVGKLIAAFLAIVLVSASSIGGYIWYQHYKDDRSETETTVTEEETEEAGTPGIAETTDTTDATDMSETSYYYEGGVYYVQAKEGLKVREGPGRTYDQVRRDFLSPEEYAQSLKGEYAALKQGSRVVCQEMSYDGRWMRISSGWICIQDGNETLVE